MVFRSAFALLLLAATPANAHHPLSGAPMETFTHGLLSGIGHPILGFDHLFFVVAMGLAAGWAGLPGRGPLAYVTAMLAGCGLGYAGVTLAQNEGFIALSLLVVGGCLALGRLPGSKAVLVMFAAFGLFHGLAFSAALTAQEAGVSAAVLSGYLAGLGGLQFAIARLAAAIAARATGASQPVRLIGAAVAGAGLFLCLEALEPAVLGLLIAS